MFGRRARSDAGSEGDGPRRRKREGRGLGPFSSGHLTIIIVTLLIVVAFPFAAFAVTGSNVFVTDAASGVRAKVNSLGQLTVTAGGSVTATQTPPGKAYTRQTSTVSDSCIQIAAAPSTQALVITNIAVNDFAPGANEYVRFLSSSDCRLGLMNITASGSTGSQEVALSAGYPLAAGHGLYMDGLIANEVDVTVNGYLVPASQCQSPNVCH